MSDPLFRPPEPHDPPVADPNYLRALMRRHWLRLATGGLALAILAAIWLAWHFD